MNSSNAGDDMEQKTKDYILYGQENPYGASGLKWDENFLNKVDIAAVYQEYLSNGGAAEDIKSFATYLTENAPIPEDWQEMVTASVYDNYGYEIIRYEQVDDTLFQAYVMIDGEEVPFVGVNARTGYYHG